VLERLQSAKQIELVGNKLGQEFRKGISPENCPPFPKQEIKAPVYFVSLPEFSRKNERKSL
jgi:hypothetical protein